MIRNIAIILVVITSWTCNKRTTIIGLQPFENFESTLLNRIKMELEETYSVKVVILVSKAAPRHTFVNIKSPRYRADLLLKHLKSEKADTIDYILGLINADISTTIKNIDGTTKLPLSKYEDWGVMGLAYLPGLSCIVSTHRLATSNEDNFTARLLKICIHEIGHNFGLDHCTSEKCVMQDAAETIKTIDNVNMELCARCKNKI